MALAGGLWPPLTLFTSLHFDGPQCTHTVLLLQKNPPNHSRFSKSILILVAVVRAPLLSSFRGVGCSPEATRTPIKSTISCGCPSVRPAGQEELCYRAAVKK